jgi:hypothetical protein
VAVDAGDGGADRQEDHRMSFIIVEEHIAAVLNSHPLTTYRDGGRWARQIAHDLVEELHAGREPSAIADRAAARLMPRPLVKAEARQAFAEQLTEALVSTGHLDREPYVKPELRKGK